MKVGEGKIPLIQVNEDIEKQHKNDCQNWNNNVEHTRPNLQTNRRMHLTKLEVQKKEYIHALHVHPLEILFEQKWCIRKISSELFSCRLFEYERTDELDLNKLMSVMWNTNLRWFDQTIPTSHYMHYSPLPTQRHVDIMIWYLEGQSKSEKTMAYLEDCSAYLEHVP